MQKCRKRRYYRTENCEPELYKGSVYEINERCRVNICNCEEPEIFQHCIFHKYTWSSLGDKRDRLITSL